MNFDDLKPKKGLACPKCGNWLRVRPDQIGEQIRCPKCDAVFTVRRPAPPKPVSPDDPIEPEVPLGRSTIGPDDNPIEIDDNPAPAAIVPMAPPDTSHMVRYEADWATDELEVEQPAPRRAARDTDEDYLQIARQRGLVREEHAKTAPRWLFFSGVFGSPWHASNVGRWATMSVGLAASGVLLAIFIQSMSGGLSLGSVAVPFLAIATAAMLLVSLSFSAACFLATIEETADGHDEVQDTNMPPLDQWVFSFLSVLGIWAMSGALGYPLIAVPVLVPIAIPISVIVLFPILLLSAMECDSFLLPWSPSVWRTLGEFPGTWLAFYVISTFLLAAWFVATGLFALLAPILVMILSGCALAAVILIYARLLGRLAWRLTQEARATSRRQTPASGHERPVESPPRTLPVQRGSKKRKKVRRLKLNLPDDLSQPPPDDQGESSSRPRLDFHKRP